MNWEEIRESFMATLDKVAPVPAYTPITRERYEQLRAICMDEDEVFQSKSRQWFNGNQRTRYDATTRVLTTTIKLGPFLIVDDPFDARGFEEMMKNPELKKMRDSVLDEVLKMYEREKKKLEDETYDWSLDP